MYESGFLPENIRPCVDENVAFVVDALPKAVKCTRELYSVTYRKYVVIFIDHWAVPPSVQQPKNTQHRGRRFGMHHASDLRIRLIDCDVGSRYRQLKMWLRMRVHPPKILYFFSVVGPGTIFLLLTESLLLWMLNLKVQGKKNQPVHQKTRSNFGNNTMGLKHFGYSVAVVATVFLNQQRMCETVQKILQNNASLAIKSN
ncbi:hypothetical protein CSKR_104940 [Clonorchis sinensis]|uniref:Uncharacterized protein n=1 Tax=Clonorchis sinensis TaxID=79923 RepID=A0A419Q730_CLOSI|nr:hypothetical protein CSKR_104940 [Clonorchis sinensis]